MLLTIVIIWFLSVIPVGLVVGRMLANSSAMLEEAVANEQLARAE